MILETLQNRSLELRKARNPDGLFLSRILSDAQLLAKADTKNGVTPVVNDDYAVKAIRTGIKQQDDMIAVAPSDKLKEFEDKRALLQSLLPAAPTLDELNAAIASTYATGSFAQPKQAIGPIMKHLVEKFGASLDRGIASKLVQDYVKAKAV